MGLSTTRARNRAEVEIPTSRYNLIVKIIAFTRQNLSHSSLFIFRQHETQRDPLESV